MVITATYRRLTVHWEFIITNLEQQQVDISILWTGMMVDGGECTYTDSALAVPQSITMNGQTVDFTMRDINGNSYGQWVNGGNGLTDISDPVAFNGAIQAFCHHIKQAVGTINENSRYDLRYPTCTLRVLDASTINGYRHVVFGFETNLHHFGGSTPQTVGTVFELAFKVQSKGKLCIKKTSANPAITDNNLATHCRELNTECIRQKLMQKPIKIK